MLHELIRHEVLEESEAVDHVCKRCNSHFYSCCGEDLSLENHSCVEVFSLDSGFENHHPRVEATTSWYRAVVRYFTGRVSSFPDQVYSLFSIKCTLRLVAKPFIFVNEGYV